MIPFSSRRASGVARRRRDTLALALALVGMLALAACGSNSSTPSATSLIQDAQKAINADSSFHFHMKLDHAGTTGAASLTVEIADGDAKKPSSLKGTATVSTAGSSLDVQFISIGDQQWVLTPLSPTWVSASQLGVSLNLSKVLDPNSGTSAILGDIQHPKNIGDDTISGDGDCWLVEGNVPAGALAAVTGGDPNATTPIDTTACIAKNLDGKGLRQLYELIFKGIAVEGDTAQTTRTFTFTKFDESVDIQPPPQQ